MFQINQTVDFVTSDDPLLIVTFHSGDLESHVVDEFLVTDVAGDRVAISKTKKSHEQKEKQMHKY